MEEIIKNQMKMIRKKVILVGVLLALAAVCAGAHGPQMENAQDAALRQVQGPQEIQGLGLHPAQEPAGSPLEVKYGPWVTAVGEDGFTVLWVTDEPGLAWVELQDGRRFYHEFAGRRIFERLHSVKVSGLEPGKAYGYSVGCAPLKDDSHPRDPKFFPEKSSSGYCVKTFDNASRTCAFAVFNDIHCDLPRYRAFASSLDSQVFDFLFLNGDIATAGNYSLDTLLHYELESLAGRSANLPVFFSRGNHEGRGNNPRLLSEIYPSSTGNFYYAFRQGPVAFVVLDGGETSEKRSIAYCGKPAFEDYIMEQMAWLKKLAREPWFRRAKQRICMIHVPMIDIGEEFNLQLWLNKHCIKTLNEAGITLMISADLHEFQFHEAGTMGNRFPILVNDDDTRVEVFCKDRGWSLRCFDKNGKETFSR